MKIHFVYAGSPDDSRIQSPHSITRNLYYFFKNKADVKYYTWDSHDDVDVEPDDIFIGHPHYDTNTTVQRFFASGKKCRLRCTIHPLHTVRVQDNMPFDHLTKEADRVFSICGPYWYDTIEHTPFAHWKPKITRVDMAVDSNIYPYLKTNFNQIGHRKLVYIGSSMPQKNLGFMYEVMKRLPTVQLHWYGGDGETPLARLPNVKTVGWVVLDKELAQKIVKECDIFINTSISDANPTTLLESTAWGLIPACTPQSGYYNDEMFTSLTLSDIEKTVQIITDLLHTPSEQLIERSLKSRKKIETHYTWNNFCNTIWNELQRCYAATSP